MPADPGQYDDYDPRFLDREPSRRARIVTWSVAAVAVIAFGIVVWYAYNLGIRAGTESVAPLIRADARPTKIKPEQPGGMAVPHQDKEVYETINPDGETKPKVERLLPPPEQPKDLPPPAPNAQAELQPQASSPAGGTEIPPPPSDELKALLEKDELAAESETAEGAAPNEPAKPEPAAPAAAAKEVAPPPPPASPKPEEPVVAKTAPPPPPTATPPTPAPKATASASMTGRWRIQLAAYRDRATTQSEWSRLQKKFPDLLGALSLEVQEADLGSKGVFYRMRGGPLADEASAKLLCAQLEQRKQGCLIVRP